MASCPSKPPLPCELSTNECEAVNE
jgi:hypothetical protein